MFGLIRIIGLGASANEGRKDRRAMLAKKSEIRLNRYRVNAAIAAAHREQEAAANAARAQLARELDELQTEIEAIKYQIAAVEATKAAFPAAVRTFA